MSVAQLRHQLRTPLNHIVGYTEMLLEDVSEPAHAACRASLEQALGAARQVLAMINTALAPTRTSVDSHDLLTLYDSLRTHQQKIVRTISSLISAPPGPPDDTFAQDLQRILAAAERLVPANMYQSAAHGISGAARSSPSIAAAPVCRILVVDDQEDNRQVLRRRLEREGYAIECAQNGREALALIADRPFDLVLLDMLMPELDGYAVLEQLKASSATRDLPVIVVSVLDDISSVVRCIERGAEDYLPKPFDPVLLRARIGASLEKKRLRDQEKEYLEHVRHVIAAATAVEAGNYQADRLRVVAQRPDALGRLARVFDRMAAQVKAREDRLRDQNRELRGEIDAARRGSAEVAARIDGGNLAAGERLAERYEILAVIGRGGMGTVYRAKDLELGEEIAIKTLRPEFVADVTELERFKSEIRLTRRITHPNVLRTHDFGEWHGISFLTMEYVEGMTVRQLIDMRGHLGVSSTLAIGRQLAEALAVAHDHGVIHRDIKPENLLVDAEGVLKVMDFGVARLAKRSTRVTEPGLAVGTPAYMSPEYLGGEDIDARSDLYAAGVVLYECVTGRRPFYGKTAVALMVKAMGETPQPPVELNPEVPAPLSTLILRLLAKRPEDRMQTAQELGQVLAHLS
jgi:DNA-binding response OmpR family regulator